MVVCYLVCYFCLWGIFILLFVLGCNFIICGFGIEL